MAAPTNFNKGPRKSSGQEVRSIQDKSAKGKTLGAQHASHGDSVDGQSSKKANPRSTKSESD